MNNKRVCAIIVTFNGSKWIEQCFGSLVNSTLPIKIIAIDNGSTDGTPTLIRDKFSEVEVIETGENLGFGKANNIGLQVAYQKNYDYAFLLNQDAWVVPGAIDQLIKIHQTHKDYGVLAPLQLNGSGSLIDQLFLEYSVAPCRELLTDVLVNKSAMKDVYKTNFVNAACWLLPKSTLQKVGGFDPLFPHYAEDNDYINRMSYQGLQVGLCPKLKVFHDREYRAEEKNWKRKSNKSYVHLLADLKNNKMPQPPKLYYFKWLFSHALNWVFGNNKNHYKAEYFAVLKIIKNYKSIILQRQICLKEKPHFID